MRKIKFRAWCKPEKAMFDVVLLEWSAATSDEFSRMLLISSNNPYTVHQIHRNDSAIDTDYVLLQFTGLLDKNGREVYEGDIVQFQTFDAQGIVTYTAPHFHASGHEIRGYEYEVIGNIYENPELVKGKQ